MSAAVCGKRSHFEDIHGGSPQRGKRTRCGGSPSRVFPPPQPFRTGLTGAAGAGSSQQPSTEEHVAHLKFLFPSMEAGVVEKVLQSCENNIDAAIKCLTELRLSTAQADGDVAAQGGGSGLPTSPQQCNGERPLSPTVGGIPSSGPTSPLSTANGTLSPPGASSEGAEWVEVVVREMMTASDLDNARLKAGRVLEAFEKVVRERTAGTVEKENSALKEHLTGLLRDNHILKRAVAIQSGRQQELEEKVKELNHAKQLVGQYQEQLRTLEMNNYALSMHLKKAQEQSTMPGRFHPDVF